MNFRVLLISLFLLFSFSGSAGAQQPDSLQCGNRETIESRFSRDSILIGDPVQWGFDIDLERLKDALWRMDEAVPYPQGVEALSDIQYDTVEINGRKHLNTSVSLTSFDSGSYRIPAFELYLKYPGGRVDTLDIESGDLFVNTVQVDTTGFVVRDIKEMMTYPLTFSEVALKVLMFLLPLALVALIVFLVIYFRKKNHKTGVRPEDPPHVVALRLLEELRSKNLIEKGRDKQFYTELSDTLRNYLEGRFDIRTMERTTNEILSDLKSCDIAGEELKLLTDLLVLADYVKFAKYKAEEKENESAIPSAVRFINSTFETLLEKEKAEAKDKR